MLPAAAFKPLDLTGNTVVSVEPVSRYLVTCSSHRGNGDEVTWPVSIKEQDRMGVARVQSYRNNPNRREG